MGYRELIELQFGKRVRDERGRRRWSQEELAKRLTQKGIDVYTSTIAKIESSDNGRRRAARIGEVAAIADLFDMSVDELLGRQGPDTSTLTFALSVLSRYASDSEQNLAQETGRVADIVEQLESIEESFPLPSIDNLKLAVQALADTVQAAQVAAHELTTVVSISITGSKPGQGQNQSQ